MLVAQFALEDQVLSPDLELLRPAAEMIDTSPDSVAALVIESVQYLRDLGDVNGSSLVNIDIQVIDERLWVVGRMISAPDVIDTFCIVHV